MGQLSYKNCMLLKSLRVMTHYTYDIPSKCMDFKKLRHTLKGDADSNWSVEIILLLGCNKKWSTPINTPVKPRFMYVITWPTTDCIIWEDYGTLGNGPLLQEYIAGSRLWSFMVSLISWCVSVCACVCGYVPMHVRVCVFPVCRENVLFQLLIIFFQLTNLFYTRNWSQDLAYGRKTL